ncbi:hypothetical protein QWA_18579 [Alcaligenes faecalis subsp. faecalis NCIB 8687]|nr:hypothetical protein QWA_18579 [Alcaligenes faecalis subsp. faecalis NCIB 8687]
MARLEIGYTWYARSAQRSHVNTAAKLLLLQHAFETLGAGVKAGEYLKEKLGIDYGETTADGQFSLIMGE